MEKIITETGLVLKVTGTTATGKAQRGWKWATSLFNHLKSVNLDGELKNVETIYLTELDGNNHGEFFGKETNYIITKQGVQIL